jgi:FdrA protein
MTCHVERRAGVYHDSVSLMQASERVAVVPGVTAAIIAMATPLNIELYLRLGFPAEQVAEVSPNELLIAVAAEDESAIDAALAVLEQALTARSPAGSALADGSPPHRTTANALRDGGTFALISVPGQHAFVEAMDALRAGVPVMLFSDNVTVEQEIALKDEATRRNLLVMGPDCGTAVVGGVGLGFANALRPGPVGIVAASGTGAQQVSCLLDASDVGVTAVLGVGGRDLSADVGGRSTIAAMKLLDAHPGTELVLVLSKPPDPAVADKVRAAAADLHKPALLAFIGRGQDDLTAVTDKALAALGVPPTSSRSWPAPYERAPRIGHVRGLFGGGTLCDEAMAIASDPIGPIWSNTPLDPAYRLGPDLVADGHVMIDFGDDALTQGRAHPMIDPALRLERIAVEAADPSCAVLLLDVVLGHGSHPDPARDLVPAIRKARETAAAAGRDLAVVVALVGSKDDPQGLEATGQALAAAGASVHLSNADAARTATAHIEGICATWRT